MCCYLNWQKNRQHRWEQFWPEEDSPTFECCRISANQKKSFYFLLQDSENFEETYFLMIFLLDCEFLNCTITIWKNTWNQNIWLSGHFFGPVFRPPFENETTWRPDKFVPFEYQTCPVFRWLLYTKNLLWSFCASKNFSENLSYTKTRKKHRIKTKQYILLKHPRKCQN